MIPPQEPLSWGEWANRSAAPEQGRVGVHYGARCTRPRANAVNQIVMQGTRSVVALGRFGEVIQYRLASGWGARWLTATGEFIGFIEP